MDSISNRDLGFEQRSSGLPNDQSSGICSASQPEKIFRKPVSLIKSSSFSSLNTATSFSVSDRDQVNSVTQNVDYKGHMVSHNQRNLSSYNVGVIENEGYMGGRLGSLLCYPLSTVFFEREPNILCFGSRNFKETVSPFATSVSLSDYQLSDHGRIDGNNGVIALSKESDRLHDPASQEHRSSGYPNMDHTLEEIGGRKRKRTQECHTPRLNPQFNVVQSREIGQSKDISHVSVEASKEIDDQKQQKNEQNPSLNANKLTTKPIKGRLQNADAPEEDCVHVRTRRGQATNSHSLAERARREKISERMKFLQALVPGCSKVTGKAVMLDEIINYVQSLQRQVEFLSMKLATVNPELDFDIDQILTKDIIHSCGDGSRALRFAPAVGAHNPFLLEPLLGALEVKMAISGIENSGGFHTSLNSQSQLLSMDQTSILCDDELQRIVQLGFASNTPLDDLTKNCKKNGWFWDPGMADSGYLV